MGAAIRAAAASALLASAAAAADTLSVYNWSDYIGEDTIAGFEAETGIDVRYETFDSNAALEAELLAGGTGYDIVVPSGAFLARQIEAGLFQPLDKSKLGNLDNLSPEFLARVSAQWPSVDRYGVVYMWGTTGIGYNTAMVAERMPDAPVGSLAMLFDPGVVSRFADCGVHVIDAADELIPAALAWIGEYPDSKDAEIIAKSEAALTAVRPFVADFNSSAYIDALASGEICLAFGWSGDVFQAADKAREVGRGVEVAFAVPSEGAQMWIDMMAIPADAPNPDAAHLFLDYILRPEVIAAATSSVYYANANPASKRWIDPAILSNPAIYPTPEVMAKLYLTTPSGPREQRLANDIRARVKAAGQ